MASMPILMNPKPSSADDKNEVCSGLDDSEITPVEYDFITVVKPTPQNLQEYRSRYNAACRVLANTGNNKHVLMLHDLRMECRRDALNDRSLDLQVSPFSDIGSAMCYGYLEGVFEAINREAAFEDDDDDDDD